MRKKSMRSLTRFYMNTLIALCASLGVYSVTHTSQCSVCATECIASTFSNTDGIFLPVAIGTSTQPGVPSPSCIKVSGIPKWSIVKGLTVKLENIVHGQANVVNVILLSPCGDAIVLLNALATNDNTVQYGDDVTGEGATFIFSDCDGISLDCNRDTNFTGTFNARPTDCAPNDYCVSNLSHRTIGTKLSETFGKPACGCWKLFTCIRASNLNGLDGSIESWSLIIDHCVPCEKPVNCNVCDSCEGCPSTSSASTTNSCHSCNSSCSSCH